MIAFADVVTAALVANESALSGLQKLLHSAVSGTEPTGQASEQDWLAARGFVEPTLKAARRAAERARQARDAAVEAVAPAKNSDREARRAAGLAREAARKARSGLDGYADIGRWAGELGSTPLHGVYGVLKLPSGVWTGRSIKDGEFLGVFVPINDPETTYEGHFVDWKLESGSRIKRDGDDRFTAGSILARGNYYYGEWRTAKQLYQGEFRHGQPDGFGVYDWEDGTRYEGEVEGGVFRGFGIAHFSNGDAFEGEFDGRAIGAFNGLGVMFTEDGARIRAGNWRDGEPVEGETYSLERTVDPE